MNYDFQTHPISYSDLKNIEISWDYYKYKKLNPDDFSQYAVGNYFESILMDNPLDNYVIGDGRTKEVKEAKKDGKTHITDKDHLTVLGMFQACMKAPYSWWLNEPFEKQVKLESTLNGIACKGFLDVLRPDRIIDVKTIDSIDRIDYQVRNYGYYKQAGMYQQLILKTKGVLLPFYFYFVEKKAPYQSVLVEIDQDYIDAGVESIYNTLDKVKKYRELEAEGEYTGFRLDKLYRPKWL